MPDLPPPVPKLDARVLLEAVNGRTGAGLEFVGRAAGGQVGAAFVRWPDGRDAVLTRGSGGIDEVRRTAEVLAAARARGLPVPEYQLLADLGDAVGVVQERLPGRPPQKVDRPLLEAMIALADRFAGIAPALPAPPLYLLESGPGYCLHESLERYDDRTRRLLGRIHEIGRAEPEGMTGDDLVHLDFHTANVLVDDTGNLTGIVDWDGIGRGDRHFGLVTLRFDAHVRMAGADLGWFDELLESRLSPGALRRYWAHMMLRQVDWSIRHHTAADVTLWLDFAEDPSFRGV
ncbi:phosphotransferase family protein [Kribbella sp.]|uniref:phosphotransferase family protein n=1 Tax=Kribbella sp. TaxID=1871183 RepID=UPI002D7006BD|nr:phosphotransferase [Kribbella sp.]HZX03148.1 phosphotransferase [Kribbella sp.]